MPPIPVTKNCLRKGHDALFVGHSNFHVQNPYQPWEVEIDTKTIDGLSGYGAYDFDNVIVFGAYDNQLVK